MASPDRDRHHGGGGWDVDWEAFCMRAPLCNECQKKLDTACDEILGYLENEKPAPPKPPKMRCVREDEPPRDVSGGVALFFFGFVIGAVLGAWWMM